MIRVDLNSCKSFIPLPYEAALAPACASPMTICRRGRRRR